MRQYASSSKYNNINNGNSGSSMMWVNKIANRNYSYDIA